MKRLIILISFLLTAVQLFAQTQYDYYEGKDAYGGVDTAISGLKIIGIIVLVIAAIVIVGGLWAKTMDLFKSPKENETSNNPVGSTGKLQDTPQNTEDDAEPVESPKDVVITIEGKIIDADVTMKDGSKKMERFWYEIDTVLYNLNNDITYYRGDDIVKPAGSTQGGRLVNKEDVKIETKVIFKCNNHLRIRGEFIPAKLQFIRIDGLGLYDRWVYYYDGEAQMQSIISDKEAKQMATTL
ncbi:MAG: hypothetical protein K6D59_06945 [Bacteroidales bacterium]|nr:hypothetical protein [Bacteroidales bacterium]